MYQPQISWDGTELWTSLEVLKHGPLLPSLPTLGILLEQTTTWLTTNLRTVLHVSTPHVSIQAHSTIALLVLVNSIGVRDVLETVHDEIWMRRSPREGTELHHLDEPRKVLDFCLRVEAVVDVWQVEQLSTLRWNDKSKDRESYYQKLCDISDSFHNISTRLTIINLNILLF